MAQEFISYIAINEDLNDRTVKDYAGDLRYFTQWLEETGQQLRIQDVAIPTLTRYREWMQNERKLKPATINRRLITLKRFFEWAFDNSHTSLNPAKPIRLIPEEKVSPRQMTDKEEAALVAAAAQGGNHVEKINWEKPNFGPKQPHYFACTAFLKTGGYKYITFPFKTPQRAKYAVKFNKFFRPPQIFT